MLRLIGAGEGQNQLHPRMEPPRFQNGLRRERVKAQRSAAIKGGYVTVEQCLYSLVKALLHGGSFGFWNFSMAGETTG